MPAKRAKRSGQAHVSSAETSLSAAGAPPSATGKMGSVASADTQLFDVSSYPLDDASTHRDGTGLSPPHNAVAASSSQASRFLPSPMRRTGRAITARAASQRASKPRPGRAARDGAAGEADVPPGEDGAAPTAAAAARAEAEAPTSDAEAGTAAPGMSLGARTLQALLRGDPVEAVVSTVVQQYGTGGATAALCGVLNLLVKAAGVVDVELDAEALRDGADIASLLEELYARLPISGVTGGATTATQPYLLAASKDPRCRRFQRALITFFELLLRRAFSADVLLRGAGDAHEGAAQTAAVLPVLAQWVGMMSESKSRAFRHTATVALLGILRALNVLVTEQQERLSVTRTKKDAATQQRLIDELAEWRNHLFSQSIHQRLRDVAAEIRLAVFVEMKLWVVRFPAEYMENRYLRYFGMALHDKRPELRVEALDMILQALAHVAEAYQRMHLFLQYFIHRLVEMSHDVDVRCAELAIRVVALIVRGDAAAASAGGEGEDVELISNEMIDHVLLSSLFDERGAIRAAAGIVLKVFLHCRTLGEADEPRRIALATELLCSFAKTLRTQYKEEMPERYLIDALWDFEQPPVMLLQYGPLLAAAQSDLAEEAVVGLYLVAALLQRARNMPLLGATSKEDRRGGGGSSRKVSASAKAATDKLIASLSKDAGAALSIVLPKHHTHSAAVLPAAAAVAAALDLAVFTGEHMTLQLSALLVELRRACSELTALRQCERDALQTAWHALAFTAHPLRNEAQAHLQELLRGVLPQWKAVLAAKGGNHDGTSTPHAARQELAVWTKVNLLSALVPLQAHWISLMSFLDAECASPAAASPEAMLASATVLQLAIGTAVNCVLWTLRDGPAQADDDDNNSATTATLGGRRDSNTSLHARIEQLVSVLLRLLPRSLDAEQSLPDDGVADDAAAEEQRRRWRELNVEVLTALCDVAALPDYATMPQLAQEQVTAHVVTRLRRLAREMRSVLEVVRATGPAATQLPGFQGDDVATPDDGVVAAEEERQQRVAQFAQARQTNAHIEAAQLRLVVAAARLFLLGRLAAGLAPRLLCEWMQTPSKAVSDAFKALFHALRERDEADEQLAGFGLERDTIVQAYNECAQLGATPASVEAFYQVGLKLASLHFAAVDRYYDACPRVVRFAVGFAANTDPLFLQAVVPYCSKLRVGDALRILQHDLGSHELFVQASNPFARTFVTALRRAAKLESGPAMPAAAAHDTAAISHKRPRELLYNASASDEAQMLAEMERQVADDEEEGQRIGVASGRLASTTHLVPTTPPRHWPQQRGVDSSEVTPMPSQTPSSQPSYVPGAAAHKAGGEGRASGRRGGRGAARSIVNVPSTQETAQSTDAFSNEADHEVFIGTEEFD